MSRAKTQRRKDFLVFCDRKLGTNGSLRLLGVREILIDRIASVTLNTDT